jgi:nucleoside-triphosphatase
MTDVDHALSPQRVFLTGEPGCGKTTVLEKTAELLALRGLKIGGMMSSEIRERGTREGFSVEDLLTHERGILANVGRSKGPRVGKYSVNICDLERVGAGAIQRAIEEADVVLIDELGPMELHSSRFIESVEAALRSRKHVLGTIHKRASHPFVVDVKSNPAYTLVEVTFANREELPVRIAERIISTK